MFERHYSVWPEKVPKFLYLPQTSVYHNLAVSALRYPQRVAIHYYDSPITYAELDRQVTAMAGYLQHLGVQAGDRVLLYMQNSPQFIIGFYAILRANAVVVPVNPMNRTAELEYLIGDTGAVAALCAQELFECIEPHVGRTALKHAVVTAYSEYLSQPTGLPLPEAVAAPLQPLTGIGLHTWAQALAAGHQPGPVTAGPEDLCVIPYSSGTTGNPKGCMHTHRSVMATAVYTPVWNSEQASQVQLICLPMYHVTGMQSCLNSCIYVGGTAVLMTRWDRRVALELIQRYQVTSWRNISTMVVDLLSAPELDRYDLGSLQGIGGGGAAMPAAIAAKLEQTSGLKYHEGYGLSETMAATHINPPQAPKAQCLGIPITGVDSRVIDPDTGRELGPKETGEIVMNGAQVFRGYWNRPDATAEAFIELEGKRFFRSGDLGYYDEEGYFFLVDRVKRMINASGLKVWPAEVESMMYAMPAVHEVCIISSPDERRGETVKAVVVRKPGFEQTTAEDVMQWCQGQMAAYKCPKLVEFVDAIPKSPTGKLMWRLLQEQERERANTRGAA
ncbi:long-chain-fatty-acid--CoA ligase [Stutzerimonas azotifigens]|uniref:long-chain-fatty-acid--CoA ligase n=1 Tax=Stutzerimonas azotifigens TaxID=291995 RepID=UPI000405F842|nr:long-chain-fatty-acid--CoA ligase [Stutzerimonas azotifigens]